MYSQRQNVCNRRGYLTSLSAHFPASIFSDFISTSLHLPCKIQTLTRSQSLALLIIILISSFWSGSATADACTHFKLQIWEVLRFEFTFEDSFPVGSFSNRQREASYALWISQHLTDQPFTISPDAWMVSGSTISLIPSDPLFLLISALRGSPF